MSRRLKQIVYGLLYLTFWCTLGYAVYRATLKPPPSCFDNRLNQQEVEIDCGGPFCEDCAIKRLIPIKLLSLNIVPGVTADTSTALVSFQNQNSTYGSMSFTYHIEFFPVSSATSTPAHVEDGEAFIYPSEIKYRALVNLPLRSSGAYRHTEAVSNVQWTPTADLSVPKTQVRTVKLTTDDTGRTVITGILRNNSPFPLLTTTVHGYVTNSITKEIIAASRTIIQDVAASEERFFQILVPLETRVDPEQLRASVSVEARR